MFGKSKIKVAYEMIEILEKQIDSLRKQNTELHDRLMARNLEEYKYQTYIPPINIGSSNVGLSEDNFAGEVIVREDT